MPNVNQSTMKMAGQYNKLPPKSVIGFVNCRLPVFIIVFFSSYQLWRSPLGCPLFVAKLREVVKLTQILRIARKAKVLKTNL